MKKRITYIVMAVVMMIVTLSGCAGDREITTPDVTTVTYIDVGQGDSALIELQNGEVMLIDAAEKQYFENISSLLEDKGITRIDYLVATHPHSDHIGSMEKIINNFEIGKFYMPDVTHTSKTFENMLVALDENNVNCEFAKAGDVIFDKDSLKAEVLSPVNEEYEELNDYSVVIKLTCGKKTFLFTGDAEKYAENLIKKDVDADVLKVGHHGSTTSTGKKFLKKVSPDYAVISCGKDNSYGHPHDEIIKLLEKEKIKIYRTDEIGNVVMICDGENINVKD